MSAVETVVVAAYLYALPVVLALLAATALRRDPVAARVLFAVVLGFGLVVGLDRIAAPLAGPARALPPGFLALWPATALALAIRLTRDRRRGHVRSTLESLAVIGSGAILLATLLSLPSILADVARPHAG